MKDLILLLDCLGLLTALTAALLWYKASRSALRRVTQTEVIDNHDFNRIVVAFNRTQRFNARAALATAASALCVAARFAMSALNT